MTIDKFIWKQILAQKHPMIAPFRVVYIQESNGYKGLKNTTY
jgi:hypothetical protein